VRRRSDGRNRKSTVGPANTTPVFPAAWHCATSSSNNCWITASKNLAKDVAPAALVMVDAIPTTEEGNIDVEKLPPPGIASS